MFWEAILELLLNGFNYSGDFSYHCFLISGL
jgi:hypothetical protein